MYLKDVIISSKPKGHWTILLFKLKNNLKYEYKMQKYTARYLELDLKTRPKLLQLCLFVTLWTVARQAPLSMGFSRQEHWGGLSCPPPLTKRSKQNDKTNIWMSYTILYLNLSIFPASTIWNRCIWGNNRRNKQEINVLQYRMSL